ncbi:serine hydrolase [Aquimarina sp. RZ0]|uniref:serine hydrolase domain-containing protein n=1 Tax=Aquimarina sp. RZ0 TaxID=2607730 RepID=UPI0011F1A470|nr:serine hydrolase domain-containing protein [Aquimarina sp. RZ0]KAA1244964.1 serine hydrolase [Aquimarina sp. RZ0]
MRIPSYLFLLFTICSFGQKEISFDLEKILPTWQQEYKVPAVAVGIIKNGKVSYAKVFGEQRIGVPANRESIFTVASLTKPIFATVVLNIISQGDLSLDEPLYKYHLDPDLKVDTNLKKLNARFVLSHQSGFVNWRNMTLSKKLAFNFEPGSQYLYSGEGYEYLRKAITNKTGEGLPKLAEGLLFEPLGLKNISFTWNPSWDTDKVVYPHNKNYEEYKYAPRTELNAAAGLLTTIEDYTKVCSYILNGASISESLFNDMMTPQVKVKENLFYGLGWEVIPELSNGESVIMHSGNENGIKTFVVLLPKSKKGMVIFTNADEGFKVYQKIVTSYLDEGEEIFEIKSKKLVPTEKYKISADLLKNYTGTFEIKENVTFNIEEENGKLKLVIPGQKSTKLVAQSEKVFLVDEELKVEFVKDYEHNFNTVILYQYCVKSYEGRRVK